MKSRTVSTALPRVRRRPRPSCCRKIVALSVGRRNSTVSTSGMSRPSLKRSTAKSTLTRRAAGPASACSRSALQVSAADGQRRDAGLVEDCGHVLGVRDADAEPERPHRPDVDDLVAELRQSTIARAGVVAGVDVGQLRPRRSGRGSTRCRAGPCRRRPRSSGTGTGGLLRAHPRAAARGGAAVEEARARRCRQRVRASPSARAVPAAARWSRIRRYVARLGVVELVDHDDVEGVGRDAAQRRTRQRLHAGEHVPPPLGARASDVELAEVARRPGPLGRYAGTARGSPCGGRRTASVRSAPPAGSHSRR